MNLTKEDYTLLYDAVRAKRSRLMSVGKPHAQADDLMARLAKQLDDKPMQFVRVVFIEYPDHHRDIVTVLEDTSFAALERLEHDIERLKPDLAHVGSLASVLTPVYPNGLVPLRFIWSTGPHYRNLRTGEEVEP